MTGQLPLIDQGAGWYHVQHEGPEYGSGGGQASWFLSERQALDVYAKHAADGATVTATLMDEPPMYARERYDAWNAAAVGYPVVQTIGGDWRAVPADRLEYRTKRGPKHWSRDWKPVWDDRTLANVMAEIRGSNFHGFELRIKEDGPR